MHQSLLNVGYTRLVDLHQFKLRNQTSLIFTEDRAHQRTPDYRQVQFHKNLADMLITVAMNETDEDASLVSLARQREFEIGRKVALALSDRTVIFAIAKTRRKKKSEASGDQAISIAL